jgi:ancient ubiquitous protein 1
MAQRVKEVLPQVPLNVIKRDLAITTNVDETITRVLDGTVSYRPEVVATVSLKPSGSSSSSTLLSTNLRTCTQSGAVASSSELPSLNTAASSFPKNANDRMKSYKERKQALVEASRARYLQKHGLVLAEADPQQSASGSGLAEG